MQNPADNDAGISIYICPVCREHLEITVGSYRCINSHSYDISSEGYVNLLLANRKHSRNPGDSKEMLDARKNFLCAGYYRPLAEKISSLIKENNKKNNMPSVILDAGCGEGYFLSCISGDEFISRSFIFYGIDISKYGIKTASRRNPGIQFAVGSIYDLPVADKVVNILISIFSPFNEKEFGRVLADNGIVISVTPGAHHLEGLKKLLYEDIYNHDEDINVSEGLIETNNEKLGYEITVNKSEEIAGLLKMTPYYYKTGKQKIYSVLEDVKELTTKAEFIIRVLKKPNRGTFNDN